MASTGSTVRRRATELPAGWVSLAYFHMAGSDATTAYSGPVLAEDADFIRVEIYSEPVTLPKKQCVIVRSAVAA